MISIIVAVSENNVIGKDNDLLWTLPTDMVFFKKKTMGGTVIMGRKTWESIPEKYRPLTGRVNIVVTRQKDYEAKGALIVNSIEQAIIKSSNNKPKYIIGGGEVYRKSLTFVDKIFLTRVHTVIEGDTTFPILNGNEWDFMSELNVQKDDKNKYDLTFEVYERK